MKHILLAALAAITVVPQDMVYGEETKPKVMATAADLKPGFVAHLTRSFDVTVFNIRPISNGDNYFKAGAAGTVRYGRTVEIVGEDEQEKGSFLVRYKRHDDATDFELPGGALFFLTGEKLLHMENQHRKEENYFEAKKAATQRILDQVSLAQSGEKK